MDGLKNPALTLALFDAVALAMAIAYFYRQMNALQVEMTQFKQALGNLVEVYRSLPKDMAERMKALEDLTSTHTSELEKTKREGSRSDNALYDLREEVENIRATLKDNGIVVEGYRRRGRAVRYEEERDEDPEEADIARVRRRQPRERR